MTMLNVKQVNKQGQISIGKQYAGKNVQVEWGAKPYREREVMVPWSEGTLPPGWKPRINLSNGIRKTIVIFLIAYMLHTIYVLIV